MNLKGLFANNIPTPMWKNKDGGNDFESMLNHLADIGRKITTLRKKAEGPVQTPGLTQQTPVAPTESKEQSVMSVEHYDATPRNLSESFNTRQTQGDRAIYKAREIVAKLMEQLNVPTSDVRYLKSDITRYGGDGTPATGRISFQMPILTPQGDSRTIYADVDILLGGLQPPQFFTDGVNRKYAFSPEGVNDFLKGRDFEVMQNPKVEPETTFFEAPGHLAGRGGIAITKTALEEPGNIKPPEAPELMPGTELSNWIVQFDSLNADIKAKQKEIKEAEAKLQESMKTSPMYQELVKYKADLKSFMESHKVFLDKISTVLSQIEGNTVKQRDRLWKITQETREARTPTYVAILGQLENELKTTIPTIKSTLDRLWLEMRSIISVKKLVVEKPESKEEYVVTEKQTNELPTYTPPEKEKGAGAGGMKRFADAISDYVADIFTNIARIEKAIDEAEKFI